MNPYELADALRTIESGWATDLTLQESANMLRQQADRIAELEKEEVRLAMIIGNQVQEIWDLREKATPQTSAEPYGWFIEKEDLQHLFIRSKAMKNFYESKNVDLLPLYTTPQTELNDGGEPVKNATYWKRQYNQAQDRIAELEKDSKPAYWVLKTGHGTKFEEVKPYCEIDYWQPLYTTPQTNSEPYGYLHPATGQFTKIKCGIPLYTTSQTKPLSDEEINQLWYESQDDAKGVSLGYTTQQHYFARAIEERILGK